MSRDMLQLLMVKTEQTHMDSRIIRAQLPKQLRDGQRLGQLVRHVSNSVRQLTRGTKWDDNLVAMTDA